MFNYNKDITMKSKNINFNKDITIRSKNVMSFEYDLDNDYVIVKGIINLNELEKEQSIVALPEKYIINDRATVLFWKDGTKTIVRRAKEDEYNKKIGFLWAYFQKNSGLSKTKANEYLDNLIDDPGKIYRIKKGIYFSDIYNDNVRLAYHNASEIAKSMEPTK